MTEVVEVPRPGAVTPRHARWVRICHWIATASIFTLGVTGFVILMAHPRLYWGDVGNSLTPALLELPISRNHQHGGWVARAAFFDAPGSPVSANRTYDIFNQNGWGRSLHFLAAWFAAVSGLVYLLAGLAGGHFRRYLFPRGGELAPGVVLADVVGHLRLRIPKATGGPGYGVLQKCVYCAVVFIALPVSVLTGLAMSPAVAAGYPFLRVLFGGFQSARTIHFLAFVALVMFVVAHVVMVVKSGFKRQMRGMTVGD
jgi:thiosulfate reductase cytochrome b subunit